MLLQCARQPIWAYRRICTPLTRERRVSCKSIAAKSSRKDPINRKEMWGTETEIFSSVGRFYQWVKEKVIKRPLTCGKDGTSGDRQEAGCVWTIERTEEEMVGVMRNHAERVPVCEHYVSMTSSGSDRRQYCLYHWTFRWSSSQRHRQKTYGFSVCGPVRATS